MIIIVTPCLTSFHWGIVFRGWCWGASSSVLRMWENEASLEASYETFTANRVPSTEKTLGSLTPTSSDIKDPLVAKRHVTMRCEHIRRLRGQIYLPIEEAIAQFGNLLVHRHQRSGTDEGTRHQLAHRLYACF